MKNIILLENTKRNKLCIQIEDKLKEERQRKILIGKQIERNIQRDFVYYRFNTISKYEDYCLYLYEQRGSNKRGGILYV